MVLISMEKNEKKIPSIFFYHKTIQNTIFFIFIFAKKKNGSKVLGVRVKWCLFGAVGGFFSK